MFLVDGLAVEGHREVHLQLLPGQLHTAVVQVLHLDPVLEVLLVGRGLGLHFEAERVLILLVVVGVPELGLFAEDQGLGLLVGEGEEGVGACGDVLVRYGVEVLS